MALDTVFRSVAKTLTGVLGQTATLTRSNASYNPVTGATTPNSDTTATIKVSPPKPYSLRQINGTTILQGDLWVVMAAASTTITPIVGDHLTVCGTKHRITNIEPIYAGGGGQVTAFTLQLRR